MCCGLDHDAAPGDAQDLATCPRCRTHRDQPLAEYARREAEHATMYRHALLDAEDDTVLARAERDHYLDRMREVYSSRERLVEVLSRIDDVHHLRGTRCVCGDSGCRVVDLLGDPRVARLIVAYDEQRRTLRELRNANPDLWTDQWDGIDVTLVYPQRDRAGARAPRGRGRHRATG